MSRTIVVGTGPVGLATADHLSTAGHEVWLVDHVTETPEQHSQVRKTYPAAAAFWTPFSSGVSAKKQTELSQLTLRFYARWKDQPSNDAGIVWKKLEQHWVKSTLKVIPQWFSIPEISAETLPYGPDYKTNATTGVHTRCEVRYSTPVIDVDKFRRWYGTELEKRNNVTLVDKWKFPFVRDWSQSSDAETMSAWCELINTHDVNAILLCTGASTHYFGLYDTGDFPNEVIKFKKGVIARIAATPDANEPVLLYEGADFDVNSLYLVPHEDCYVLGGTINATQTDYAESDWMVSESEIEGIKERARTYLPESQRSKLEAAGLWGPGQSLKIEWRVGVRPVIEGLGPRVLEAKGVSLALGDKLGRDIRAFTHFGHGGSGFTFCHDTASLAVKAVS